MKNFDPYKLLGVGKEATQAQIKAAWRKKISQFHPDRAVDESQRKEFEEISSSINVAYAILSDEEKLERYKRTKSVDEAMADIEKNEAIAMVMALLSSITSMSGTQPINLVKASAKALDMKVERSRKEILSLERDVSWFERQSKFYKGKPDNPVSMWHEAMLGELRLKIDSEKRDIRVTKRALAMVNEVEYVADEHDEHKATVFLAMSSYFK